MRLLGDFSALYHDVRRHFRLPHSFIEGRLYSLEELKNRDAEVTSWGKDGVLVISQGRLRKYLGELCNEFGHPFHEGRDGHEFYIRVLEGPIHHADFVR